MKKNKMFLFFVDNIFRFIQAGSEVSALLGKNPFCRRISTHTFYRNGKFTRKNHIYKKRIYHFSSTAIYVPADDYTDPAPATAFSHLDATTNLDREIAALGIYPAVHPLQFYFSNSNDCRHCRSKIIIIRLVLFKLCFKNIKNFKISLLF